jgi:hypothetical protein
LPVAADRVREKGRLRPGEMLLVNTTQGCLQRDEAIKAEVASLRPYKRWLAEQRRALPQIADVAGER